jgi:glycosyltransferase involved in cell wall biosynthesis
VDIIFFAHPKFLQLRSMDSYAEMLATGMMKRGHNIQLWYPKPVLSKLPVGRFAKKWLSYIDQYIIFPNITRTRIKACNVNTLFVFTDQALGPWVPLVKQNPHVIHCHDFLALSSAMGEFSENRTGWTGRQYQHFIRRGFLKGKNFISVSKNTNKQLNRFLTSTPGYSDVVYNGIKTEFKPYPIDKARGIIQNQTGIAITSGYLLHIGGNQWYKNRTGVIEIYNAWRSTSLLKYPLLLLGAHPSNDLINLYKGSPFKEDIHFLTGMNDEFIRYAYAGASVFLFPSFAEGFGLPIVEAMACGCKVITTKEAPMTEVAGDACFYISRRPKNKLKIAEWAISGAELVEDAVKPSDKNNLMVEAGIINANRFNVDSALNQIEIIYRKLLMQNC